MGVEIKLKKGSFYLKFIWYKVYGVIMKYCFENLKIKRFIFNDENMEKMF